jgi:hypothetical protein
MFHWPRRRKRTGSRRRAKNKLKRTSGIARCFPRYSGWWGTWRHQTRTPDPRGCTGRLSSGHSAERKETANPSVQSANKREELASHSDQKLVHVSLHEAPVTQRKPLMFTLVVLGRKSLSQGAKFEILWKKVG